MVVDTSALVAILLKEADADRFEQLLVEAPLRLLSAATRVELFLVIEGRYGSAGRSDLEALLSELRFDIMAFTPELAEIASEAFRRYGRGRHRAALDIGDCFSYALAESTDLPLLCKGDDFSHTDIRPALR